MEPESERMVAELRQLLGADETIQRKSREILGLCLGRSMLTAFAMTVTQAQNQETRLFAIVDRTVTSLCEDLHTRGLSLDRSTILINKYSSGVPVLHTEESLRKAGSALKTRMQTSIAKLDKASVQLNYFYSRLSC